MSYEWYVSQYERNQLSTPGVPALLVACALADDLFPRRIASSQYNSHSFDILHFPYNVYTPSNSFHRIAELPLALPLYQITLYVKRRPRVYTLILSSSSPFYYRNRYRTREKINSSEG